MIQARRIDTDENIVQPIGKFTALDDEIDAINKCINEPYGVSQAFYQVCHQKLFFLFLNQNICCDCSKEQSQ